MTTSNDRISIDNFELIDKHSFVESCIRNPDRKFVIFGYASLITVPNFKYASRKTGCVKHVATRFYQGSLSLGTEIWPGRVATLVSCTGNLCFGEAFYIDDKSMKIEAWEYLLQREKHYSLIAVDFYPLSNNEILDKCERVVTFVALPDNDMYLGDCEMELQAYQIWKAVKTWPNTLYLENLLGFYRKIPDYLQNDDYIYKLKSLVDRLSTNEIVLTQEQLQQLPKRFKNQHH